MYCCPILKYLACLPCTASLYPCNLSKCYFRNNSTQNKVNKLVANLRNSSIKESKFNVWTQKVKVWMYSSTARQQLSDGPSSPFTSIPEIKATVYEYIPEQTKQSHTICDIIPHPQKYSFSFTLKNHRMHFNQMPR